MSSPMILCPIKHVGFAPNHLSPPSVLGRVHMPQFLAVSNRKGGVGKSTLSVMLAHAFAAWSGLRVLVMDLDTQCNASLMLLGGENWQRACQQGRTISDYFYGRFDKVAEDESAYVLNDVGSAAFRRVKV